MCKILGYIIASKRACLVIVFCLISSVGKGQEISVTDFYYEKSDLTANTLDTQVLDQNGDKCALIRVQTTQKNFLFDVGTMGVTKTDDNHTGEIWVYVPYGVKHISIRHEVLGSLPNYNFPISIKKARTYIMKITSDKVFVNTYDDSRKQDLLIQAKYPAAVVSLNGMRIELNDEGLSEQSLSFGTYTYRIEAEGYYPEEGQIIIDNPNERQTLRFDKLKPIMGTISVFSNPSDVEVYIDNDLSSDITSADLQVGKHIVEVRKNGYATQSKTIEIKKGELTEVSFSLSQLALYRITTTPSGADISIDGKQIGTSPCSKELVTGSYNIEVAAPHYKTFNEDMNFDSSNPYINIKLLRIYNTANEFYVELNGLVGSYFAGGITLGGYISNINIEASYFYGFGQSEPIYWNSEDIRHIECLYSPSMTISAKVGYGIPLGTRFRLTPQVGASYLRLSESAIDYSESLSDGANSISLVGSLRFSVALSEHFALSLSPGYSYGICRSEGYEVLRSLSPKIKSWESGFSVMVGVTVYF